VLVKRKAQGQLYLLWILLENTTIGKDFKIYLGEKNCDIVMNLLNIGSYVWFVF
jgi:hypothetical protein